MNQYKVEIAKLAYQGGIIEERYFITENKIPMLTICQWLDNVSLESTLTGRHYAYCLVGFLRYLDSLGMKYKDLRNKSIIWSYIKKLMYEDKNDNVSKLEGQKSHNSIYHNISIICNFYFWLDECKNGVVNKKEIKEFTDIDVKYIYTNIWGTKFFNRSKSQATPFKMKFKKRRDSHRWYSDEELDCFMTAFNTKRDLAIFLIGVEGGCRIEEILTIKHYDYYANKCKVWISESKTITRDCYLPQYVCDIIDDYLSSEKLNVELNLDKQLDEYLFVNLRNGEEQGGKVNQNNYRRILKRVGKRIGLNPSKVITHAGRSTKAQEMIEQGNNNFEIMEVMGWSSITTVESYRKQFSPKFAKKINDKVTKRRRSKRDIDES